MENIKQITEIKLILPYDMPADSFLDHIDKTKISIIKFTSENKEIIYLIEKKDGNNIPLENNK